MYMMSADQYDSMNKEKKNDEGELSMEGGGKTEGDDVKIAKLHDMMIRKQDAKQIKTDKHWSDLGARLKPILSSVQDEKKEILKQFPDTAHAQVEFILNILNRLPKVSLTNTQLLIDGQALSDPLKKVISDIMKNEIKGVENVIQKLRTSDDDWDIPFESFSNTMQEYMKDGESASSPKYSPIKTRAKARSEMKAKSLRTYQERTPRKSLQKLAHMEQGRSRKRKKQDGSGRQGNTPRSKGWEPY